MKTLKELIRRFNTQTLVVKLLVSIITICVLICISFLITKFLPYIILVMLLTWLVLENLKEKKIEEQRIANMNQQYQNNLLYSIYLNIAEQLVNVLREYNTLIDIKVTTPNSILCTNKTRCKQQNSVWFYRYLVECVSDKEIDYDEIRNIINKRLLQESFDYPIWIKQIYKRNNYLELVATVIDNEFSFNYREQYELMQRMKNTKSKTDTLDKDF